MFRKNKKTQNDTPSSPAEETASPIEVDPLRIERVELTKRCGELATNSAHVFNRELAAARERGLSAEEQEEYLKSLMAERKIPRIGVNGMRNHSTRVTVLDPDKIGYAKILYLTDYETDGPSSRPWDTPTITVDVELMPDSQEEAEGIDPIVDIGYLSGYYEGEMDPSFMPPAKDLAERVERLRGLEALLQEASLVGVPDSLPDQI